MWDQMEITLVCSLFQGFIFQFCDVAILVIMYKKI
jgi:hypothetical protein